MNVSSELPIDLVEIDSFKLRILSDKVEILDVSLRGKWVLLHEVTGEVDSKQFKENCISINNDGIKTKYSIGKKALYAGEPAQEYLIIQINSKLLKERYFEGITKDNIKLVYSELMKHNIVKFSYEDFLQSEITDVDFKRDRLVKDFGVIVSALLNITKPSKKKGEGAQAYRRENNLGIEFSDRDTTSFTTNPFLKFYHKGLELKKGDSKDSREFYAKYLFESVNDSIVNDRVRAEYTIKNKKHFRYYGISDTTLKNVLNISQADKLTMLKDIVNKHLLDKQVRERVRKEDLTPNDSMILEMLDAMIQLGMAFSQAVDKAISGIMDKSVKSKKKKFLTELYEFHIKGNEYDIRAENTLSFLNWLRG